jgi:RNA polymerase sigma-70 factor (ECF subfamily)
MISIRRLSFANWRRPETEASAHVAEIYRYVYARINHVEHTEDIAMEVLHAASTSEKPDDMRAFMIGIARRKVADHFRRNTRIEPQKQTDEQFITCDADEFLRIQMVLGRLADNYQECLVLKYVCGFSSDEIATMLTTTPTAVDNTLQRARKAFASEWNQLNGDENE